MSLRDNLKKKTLHSDPLVIRMSSPRDVPEVKRVEDEPRAPRIRPRHSPLRQRSVIRVLLLALAIGVVLGGVMYFFTRRPSDQNSLPALSGGSTTRLVNDTTTVPAADIVAKVGKLILLPEGETPTLATVTDLAPLRDQLFFKNARVGDVVLMYATAQKAILYNPAQNKIIEVGPIKLDAQN